LRDLDEAVFQPVLLLFFSERHDFSNILVKLWSGSRRDVSIVSMKIICIASFVASHVVSLKMDDIRDYPTRINNHGQPVRYNWIIGCGLPALLTGLTH
jgi:hypothetical protein